MLYGRLTFGAHVGKFWDDLRSGYWFIPSVMTLLAAALSVVMVLIDTTLGASLIDDVPWLYINQPEGARAVLSSIAGSMITVAGVVFSITIASVVYASSQYGPRILGNFMRNRGNQVTLGTFIATFIYCLLVLRTVRSGGAEGAGAFVPHLSLLVGILLGLCSVGVLIFFIHHVPDTIHLPHVVAGIGDEFMEQIGRLYPEQVGRGLQEEREPEPDLPENFLDEAEPVYADGAGYLQAIDGDLLIRVAADHDLLVRVEYRPGDFISQGQRLAWAWPGGRVNPDVSRRLLRAFAWGRQRTALQDILFPVDELVEIAARALSPAMNDPFTAMNCLDWLTSGLMAFARRDIPAAFLYDGRGSLRVISHPVNLTDLIEAVFGQMIPYFRKDRNATLHMMKVFAALAGCSAMTGARPVLLRFATALYRTCSECMVEEYDRQELEERYRVVTHLLRNHSDHVAVVEANRWIEGGA